jgi:hypothetical protein
VRSTLATANVRACLPLLIVLAYIAVALVPGPRRVTTGAELPILIGVGAVLAAIALCRPRRGPYLVGAVAIGIAFASVPRAPLPGPPGGWVFTLMFLTGWILLGSALHSWRAGVASYVAAGLWTLLLLAAPEGVTYFGGPLHDVDQFFWKVLAPVVFWPHFSFGMLSVFGVRFV